MFEGSDYNPKKDKKRLTTQLEKIRSLMEDECYRTLGEISELVRAPTASVSAQLRNLRKAIYGSHFVHKRLRNDGCDGVWEYKVSIP